MAGVGPVGERVVGNEDMEEGLIGLLNCGKELGGMLTVPKILRTSS